MAHLAQKNFFLEVKTKHPHFFKKCSVLDVGSLDINGNNRFLFEEYEYIGLDVGEGPNVDIVVKGHEYKTDKLYDVVISSECFEHDMYYKETIKNCIDLTKSGGLFTFTCASTGRPEHGTRRTKPEDAPFLNEIDEWGDYYKNLTENDMREIFSPDDLFSSYEFIYDSIHFDLYFWGIKK